MAKEFSRSRRVGEQIQRDLADLLRREVKDPRVGMVTVSDVEVSRDMAYARVFVTTLDPNADIPELLGVLQGAAGFLRRELGRRLRLRSVPELRFLHDTSFDYGSRIDRLLNEAASRDRRENDED